MKNNFKRVLTLALFGLGLSGFFGLAKTSATYADEKPSEKPKVQIQISPVKNTVYLKGGDVSDFTFNVSNIGTDPFDFKVYATPYSVSNEKYELNFSKESSRTQITRWTTFEDASGKYVSDVTYSVQPNETKVVKYRVTVPQLKVKLGKKLKSPNTISTVSVFLAIFAPLLRSKIPVIPTFVPLSA